MSVRVSVRINGSTTGAALKINPWMSKNDLVHDSLRKLEVDGAGQVDKGLVKLYLSSGDKVSVLRGCLHDAIALASLS